MLELQLATTEFANATMAAAGQGGAYEFLSLDMLRSEETGHLKGSRMKV